jgi:hypothetical protein
MRETHLHSERGRMATPPPPAIPAIPASPPQRQLAATLTTLAGTPDDDPQIDTLLVTIARLVADIVEPVSYASVTAYRDGALTTVAASSQVAVAVDLAQYADDAGPCLDALSDGKAVEVPDVAAVMLWPRFRDRATQLGLRSSLSIPLFAGSGAPIAALNLYAHDPDPMAALTRRVWAVYDIGSDPDGDRAPAVDEGSRQLLTGIAAAFQLRDLIQQALGAIIAREHITAEAAYLALRTKAAETGATLPQTAIAAIQEQEA